MRYMYPAIFTCKRDKHMIVADFPDIAGCRAYGHTMEEAMESARVALCRTLLELEERSEIFSAALRLHAAQTAESRMHYLCSGGRYPSYSSGPRTENERSS